MLVTCEDKTTPGSALTLTEGLTRQSDLTGRGLAMKATRTCSIDRCDRVHAARGYCATHYRYWTEGKDPATAVLRVKRAPATCTVEHCGTGGKIRRGLCEMHYKRWRVHGDPSVALLTMGAGDDVTNTAAHERVRRARGRAVEHACQDCGTAAAHWAYDHADPDERQSDRGPYSPDPAHYRPLCVPCHKRFDLDHLQESSP